MNKRKKHCANQSHSSRLWYWSPISYTAFFLAAPYYLIRMFTTQKYRAGLRQRLTLFSREEKKRLQSGPYIWIHAVSVGELMAAQPLLKRLKQEFPAYKTLVTTVTDTGQGLARKLDEVDIAIYLPLDLYPLCRRVLRWVQPVCLLIMETELWPNFIRAASDSNVPFFLLNARLSDKSFKNYWRFKPVFRPLLNRFSKILTQSQEDHKRFLEIGAPDDGVSVMGNIKFEAAPQPDDGTIRMQWRKLFGVKEEEILLLGGSTFPGEESILVQMTAKLRKENIPLRLVIAPRHIERTEEILNELKWHNVPIMQRSHLNDNTGIDPQAVILLDTIGELKNVYAAADIVFMGKSICGRGGQNPVEAAAWGRPVLFGKNMQNFRDIAEMFVRSGVARTVEDETELMEICRELCENPKNRIKIGNKALSVVQENLGSLERIIEAIHPIFGEDNQAG